MFSVLFPGQGSQTVGMGKIMYQKFDYVKELFNIADDILQKPISKIILEGPKDLIDQTENTQPAIFLISYSICEVIKKETSFNLNQAAFFAGHSLGEYSAYVAAETLQFEEALELVTLRAKFMQEAVREDEGGIAAILGLSQEVLKPICDDISEKGDLVSMANLNSDNQIVISGTKSGVDKAIVTCKENGAKRAVPLAMSVPSHCKLMTPASVNFSRELDSRNFKEPKTKVIQNFSVTHTDDIEVIKNNLVSQLYSPVRWSETMDYFKNEGITNFFECGPSKVLTGLIKRKFENVDIFSLDDFDTLNNLTNL